MNKETTCCFTGPRRPRLPMNGNEYSKEVISLKTDIRSAVFDAYYDGFRFFMNGMADGFDLFAAETVLAMREEFEDIALIAVLPYSGAPDRHSASLSNRLNSVLKKADMVISLMDDYIPGCELLRNKYMVEHSTRIIGYYNGLSAGTAHCWNFALENGLETVNLYDSF